jgi:DNA-binding response OmpR family regulator
MTFPDQALHDEIASQRRRIEYLEAENHGLKQARDDGAARLAWKLKLSRTQARILFALSKGEPLTRHALLYECENATDDNNAVQQIDRIRNKVTWLSIQSRARSGLGYWLDGESLARVRAIIKGENHA